MDFGFEGIEELPGSLKGYIENSKLNPDDLINLS